MTFKATVPAARLACLPVLAALLCAAGCNLFVPQAQYDQLAAQVNPLKTQVRKLTEENETLRADVVDKRKQIDSLLALGGKRMDLVTHATAIELGDFTAAYNLDATSKIPNSVKVYLLPKDGEGSIVKAGGSLQNSLFLNDDLG